MTTRTILPKSVNYSSQLNGVALTFSFTESFIPGTVKVWLNGLLQTPGTDFTEGNRSFTLTGTAPEAGENLVAEYFPAEALAASQESGYAQRVKQIADQYGTPRRIYD